MTARELLLKQITDAENQLTQSIAGLDSEHASARANEAGRSIRELVQHLAETAVATLATFEGREHQWGSYAPEDRSWEGVKRARKEALEKAIASIPEEDAVLESTARFLVSHTCYHIGQIVSARLTVHPEWDAYVIYRPAY